MFNDRCSRMNQWKHLGFFHIFLFWIFFFFFSLMNNLGSSLSPKPSGWSTSNPCKPGPCDSQVTTLLEIAESLGYPMDMADSWTGNDPCQGWRFISCDFQKITVINFAKMGFVGTISPSFANLTFLRNLLLSDNILTGSIPDVLKTLTHLELLDVSNNNLMGRIPDFPPFVTVKSSGNPFLGTNSSSESDSGSGLVFGLLFGILIVVGIIIFVLFFYKRHCNKKHHDYYNRKHHDYHRSIQIEIPENGKEGISIEELQKATNNFSEYNILGKGGFGTVYKGKLCDGREIAVKKMESTAGLNEFQAEIAVLTKVRHMHLVALLGFCINGNERLLVYEYMPQGTLGQHLFEFIENGYPPLTWNQRVTIALDVARGIEYLHSLVRPSFIHRDLKASNILLGDDMRAKVSDFGLTKNLPDGKDSVSTRVAGTFGYLAPEYFATGRVTRKVDVYAFGVVLMAVITGRKAVDENLTEDNSHLVTWFIRILNNDIRNAIDPILNRNLDDESFRNICRVAELARLCTSSKRRQRPDMSYVVNILGPLVQQWKPTSHEEDNSDSGIHPSQILQDPSTSVDNTRSTTPKV